MLNVGQKVSELRRMTVGELRREYAEVFGEQTRSFHKEFLVRRIAWRMHCPHRWGRCRNTTKLVAFVPELAVSVIPP